MEYFNRILCVTYAELTGGSDAVIKAATLRQNMSRGNIVSVHRGGGEGGQAHSTHGVPFLRNTRLGIWNDTVIQSNE